MKKLTTKKNKHLLNIITNAIVLSVFSIPSALKAQTKDNVSNATSFTSSFFKFGDSLSAICKSSIESLKRFSCA